MSPLINAEIELRFLQGLVHQETVLTLIGDDRGVDLPASITDQLEIQQSLAAARAQELGGAENDEIILAVAGGVLAGVRDYKGIP